jgi:GntR family phosphonate transport system transcriptional regulator
LKRLGVNDVLREETRITTTISSRTDAEYLRQPKSQPVLFVRNILVDENGTPVLLSQVRMSPLWIELVIRYGE